MVRAAVVGKAQVRPVAEVTVLPDGYAIGASGTGGEGAGAAEGGEEEGSFVGGRDGTAGCGGEEDVVALSVVVVAGEVGLGRRSAFLFAVRSNCDLRDLQAQRRLLSQPRPYNYPSRALHPRPGRTAGCLSPDSHQSTDADSPLTPPPPSNPSPSCTAPCRLHLQSPAASRRDTTSTQSPPDIKRQTRRWPQIAMSDLSP